MITAMAYSGGADEMLVFRYTFFFKLPLQEVFKYSLGKDNCGLLSPHLRICSESLHSNFWYFSFSLIGWFWLR